MQCPFCKYSYGVNYDNAKEDEEFGNDFYKLPILMERNGYNQYPLERVEVYACPECKRLFIER